MNIIEEWNNDEVYVKLWNLDSIGNTIFVTHITQESSTRYEFKKIDKNKTVAYSKARNTTPPRVVIEILNENDYTISNIPNISEDNLIMRIKKVMAALDWIEKHGNINSNDIRKSVYDRVSTSLPVVYFNVILRECIGPAEFVEQLDKCIEYNNLNFTKEEMVNSRICNIELLQRMIVEIKQSLPIEVQNEINDRVIWMSSNNESYDKEKAEQRWDDAKKDKTDMTISDEARYILQEQGWL